MRKSLSIGSLVVALAATATLSGTAAPVSASTPSPSPAPLPTPFPFAFGTSGYLIVPQGTSGTLQTFLGTYSQTPDTVSLVVSGEPAGVSASFDQTTVLVQRGNQVRPTLTVSVPVHQPVSRTDLTLTASDASGFTLTRRVGLLITDIITGMFVYDFKHTFDWTVQVPDAQFAPGGGLHAGDLVYGDRSDTFTSVPQALVGADWIRPAAASKSFKQTPLMTFGLPRPADVYVALDVTGSRPTWVDSTWQDSGLRERSSRGVTYELYVKRFQGAPVPNMPTITFGPAGRRGAMYTVVVV